MTGQDVNLPLQPAPLERVDEPYVLRNAHGMRVMLSRYGASIIRLDVPDRYNQSDDVVLGFDSAKEYQGPHPHFGGTIGRYANRIKHAMFTLGNMSYTLSANEGNHCLHGGVSGFDRYVWSAQVLTSAWPSVRFSRRSPHGEEGFPGNMDVSVTYTLTEQNELVLFFMAKCDRPTVISLTNHSYFNLAGRSANDILNHHLKLNSAQYLPLDDERIPIGEIAEVAGTPLDFRQKREIGLFTEGLDHSFVLPRRMRHEGLVPAAELFEPTSGRHLEVLTDQPCVQVYSGNFLDGTIRGKEGRYYGRCAGICLETQNFPDAPNQSAFPSARLNPGDTYQTTTIYKFSTERSPTS